MNRETKLKRKNVLRLTVDVREAEKGFHSYVF